jgi:uncharacterized membrane protein YdbT with pleckstrin-like domain
LVLKQADTYEERGMSEIDEGLISGEQVVTRTAKHWFAPLADSKWAILMLIGWVALNWIEPSSKDGLLGFIWRILDTFELGLFIGAIGWIVYNVIAWRTAEYAVTTFRVRGHEGLIRKKSTDTLLSSITDVGLKTSFVGRSLGFGNLRVLTGSGDAGEDTFTSVVGAEAFKVSILEQKAAAARAETAPQVRPTAEPVAPVAAPTSADAMATLGELAKLRDAGAITPEEYEAKKTEILARV